LKHLKINFSSTCEPFELDLLKRIFHICPPVVYYAEAVNRTIEVNWTANSLEASNLFILLETFQTCEFAHTVLVEVMENES